MVNVNMGVQQAVTLERHGVRIETVITVGLQYKTEKFLTFGQLAECPELADVEKKRQVVDLFSSVWEKLHG